MPRVLSPPGNVPLRGPAAGSKSCSPPEKSGGFKKSASPGVWDKGLGFRVEEAEAQGFGNEVEGPGLIRQKARHVRVRVFR